MPYMFEQASKKYSKSVPEKDRKRLFGNSLIMQVNNEPIYQNIKDSLSDKNHHETGQHSDEKFKLRQGFWFLDEAADQMLWLRLLLEGWAGGSRGKNLGILTGKTLTQSLVQTSSGAIGGLIGGAVAGPTGAIAGATISSMAGKRSYKNLERGFASKNPWAKVKGLYPSTSKIEKALTNAYYQRDYKSVKTSEAAEEGGKSVFELLKKAGNVLGSIGGYVSKTVPVWDLTKLGYSYIQSHMPLTEEKYLKITELLDAIEQTTVVESAELLDTFEKLDSDSISQSVSTAVTLHLQFKKGAAFEITPKKIGDTRDGILANITLNRVLIQQLRERYSNKNAAENETNPLTHEGM